MSSLGRPDATLVAAMLFGVVASCLPSRELRADLVVDDFSNSTNTESSRWSYRYSADSIRDGVYSLLTVNSDPNSLWDPATPFWHTGDGSIPAVGVNRSGAAIPASSSSFSWPDQTVWMHPASATQFNGVQFQTVVSWLSPSNMVVDVKFSFSDMDSSGFNGVLWYVDLGDGSGNLAAGTLANGGSTGLQSLSNVAVSAGQRINFILQANGNFGGDSTAFDASITAVPEASAALFLGLGAATAGACAAVRRRPGQRDGATGVAHAVL